MPLARALHSRPLAPAFPTRMISTMMTIAFVRKSEVVHKQVGGYLTRCARIAASIAKIDNHQSLRKKGVNSPSSLGTHIEERYITIFRMQNNSQIIICENISRR